MSLIYYHPDSSILSFFSDVALNNALAAAKSMRKCAGTGIICAHWSSHPSMTHKTFAWPAFLLTASLSWNGDTPESYLKAVMSRLLDTLVFGACGFSLDGSWRQEGSVGRALLDLGSAEAVLDKKQRLSSVIGRRSSDSVLLRLLMCTDDVSLDHLTIEDFGVSYYYICFYIT